MRSLGLLGQIAAGHDLLFAEGVNGCRNLLQVGDRLARHTGGEAVHLARAFGQAMVYMASQAIAPARFTTNRWPSEKVMRITRRADHGR